MKKFLACVLALAMLACFAACGDNSQVGGETTTATQQDNTMVTIHVPKTICMTLSGEGHQMVIGPADYNYEDGWQTKDSFTVTYTLPVEGMHQTVTTTFSQKKATTKITAQDKETSSSEIIYNEQGKVASQVTYTAAEQVEKTENKYTYDEKGRTLVYENIIYYTDMEPVRVKQEFTITETADGSVGVCKTGGIEYRYTYDADYRLVSNVTIAGGQEMVRVAYTYDALGNMLTQSQHTNTGSGWADTEMTYTYEAVEVSPERAAQLNWYKYN